MKITKARFGKDATAMYLARFRRRGEAMKPKTRASDIAKPRRLDAATGGAA